METAPPVEGEQSGLTTQAMTACGLDEESSETGPGLPLPRSESLPTVFPHSWRTPLAPRRPKVATVPLRASTARKGVSFMLVLSMPFLFESGD